jgi:hypothetical protein
MSRRSTLPYDPDMPKPLVAFLEKLDKRRLTNVAKPTGTTGAELKASLDALIDEMIARGAMEES